MLSLHDWSIDSQLQQFQIVFALVNRVISYIRDCGNMSSVSKRVSMLMCIVQSKVTSLVAYRIARMCFLSDGMFCKLQGLNQSDPYT